jgi:hypothetical protein
VAKGLLWDICCTNQTTNCLYNTTYTCDGKRRMEVQSRIVGPLEYIGIRWCVTRYSVGGAPSVYGPCCITQVPRCRSSIPVRERRQRPNKEATKYFVANVPQEILMCSASQTQASSSTFFVIRVPARSPTTSPSASYYVSPSSAELCSLLSPVPDFSGDSPPK